jgi:hypothetical protein
VRDGHQLDAVLRQLPDVKLHLEVIAEEAREAMHHDNIEGAGFDVPASIIRWNSGRLSLVAVAPGSI